jgi:hypothetical protein
MACRAPFQPLDDCLDGKAGHLLGVLGDGGQADVGESGQPRVVVADDRDLHPARRRRPTPARLTQNGPPVASSRKTTSHLIGGPELPWASAHPGPGLPAINAALARLA